MMPASDEYSERTYDLINGYKDEPVRLELWRSAFLVVQYKAQQMERKRMQRAIDKRAAERKALRRDTQQCAE